MQSERSVANSVMFTSNSTLLRKSQVKHATTNFADRTSENKLEILCSKHLLGATTSALRNELDVHCSSDCLVKQLQCGATSVWSKSLLKALTCMLFSALTIFAEAC